MAMMIPMMSPAPIRTSVFLRAPGSVDRAVFFRSGETRVERTASKIPVRIAAVDREAMRAVIMRSW